MSVKPDDRAALLDVARARKMARSVHAYVRGNTAQFYEWLGEMPGSRHIPKGPPVWICGDCHLGNLGPLADAEGTVAIQIRDLDQTVIGNPALDLIRLGLSLATATRSSDLPGVTTAQMMAAMIAGYDRALARDDSTREPEVVRTVRKRAMGRRWRHLARERIGDCSPSIPLGKRFWRLAKEERAAIDALFEDENVRDRTLDLANVGAKGQVRVVDAAYWRKGCSSLGHLRYAVLLGVRRNSDAREFYALVDIKEAVATVVPTKRGVAMPDDAALRVVTGARALSPHLGDRMIATRLLGRPVVLRELAPQDLKLEVGQFSRREAEAAAGYLAYVVGRAHGRQLDKEQRTAWRAALTARSDDAGTAPSWLWRSVVDLSGAHEVGYLDHCRRFMEQQAQAAA